MTETADLPRESRLVVRSVLRYWWLGGFMIIAEVFAAVGIGAVTGEKPELALVLAMFACALLSALCALSALRWAIVGDRDGVSITNYGRPRTIPWSELEDIRLVKVQSELDLGFHYLLFVTRTGQGIRPAAPTGRDRPGGRLRQIQHDLLSMRDHYLSASSMEPTLAGGRSGVSTAGLVLSLLGLAVAAAPLAVVAFDTGGSHPMASGVPAVRTSSGAAPSPTTLVDATTSETAAPQASPLLKARRIYWESLKPAMCVRENGSTSTLTTVVDCRTDHQAEVFASTVVAGPRKWPGDPAMSDAAMATCRPAFAAYVGVPPDDSRLGIDYYTPDAAGWRDGDHTLICLVLDPADQHLTRALRGVNE